MKRTRRKLRLKSAICAGKNLKVEWFSSDPSASVSLVQMTICWPSFKLYYNINSKSNLFLFSWISRSEFWMRHQICPLQIRSIRNTLIYAVGSYCAAGTGQLTKSPIHTEIAPRDYGVGLADTTKNSSRNNYYFQQLCFCKLQRITRRKFEHYCSCHWPRSLEDPRALANRHLLTCFHRNTSIMSSDNFQPAILTGVDGHGVFLTGNFPHPTQMGGCTLGYWPLHIRIYVISILTRTLF